MPRQSASTTDTQIATNRLIATVLIERNVAIGGAGPDGSRLIDDRAYGGPSILLVLRGCEAPTQRNSPTKQVFRRVIDRRGRVVVVELPEPHLGPDQVLVQSQFSLISSGTETTTLSKTPMELVKQTVADPWMRNVVKQTVLAGWVTQTARRVWHEMITPREIGYSGAGTALARRRRSTDSRSDRRSRTW